MIERERLAQTFCSLVEIDSVSREERRVCKDLEKRLESIGTQTFVDGSGSRTGSDSGNLIAYVKGNVKAPALLLSAHMDTVEPGRDVKTVRENGVISSSGETILGGDDKSAIAIILEAILVIKENDLVCPPLEIVFTTCEEIGLLGAKNMDYSALSAKYGYVLDTKDIKGIITRAPAARWLKIKVYGKDAHAGLAPEKGINAISLAGKAIAGIETGAIDDETTVNIGKIKGGIAPNIVPNLVTVTCEVRSHSNEKLNRAAKNMLAQFNTVVQDARKTSGDAKLRRIESEITDDIPNTSVADDHLIVALAQKAAVNLGERLTIKTSGGCADANLLFRKGIMTGVLGTGMQDVHTVRESICLDDMVWASRLLLEIIALHAKT